MEHTKIVEAVRSTTHEVLSTMLSLSAVAEESYVERNPPGPSDGIISVVGLAGSWMGTGNLCCSSETAIQLSSAMLMTEFTEVDDEVLDAMSELTNMIIGNFKTIAEESLGPLGLSIPTVLFGMQFRARSAGKENWSVVPFRVGENRLEIRICMTRNRGLSHLNLQKLAAQPAVSA